MHTPVVGDAESVSRWTHYASQAEAIHRLSRNLKDNRQISIEDLEPMEDLFPDHQFDQTFDRTVDVRNPPGELTREDHERILAVALHTWLGMGDVGFHVNWRKGKSSLRFGGTGLFGALALQLTLVSNGTGALIICSECTLPYIPPSACPARANRTTAPIAVRQAFPPGTGSGPDSQGSRPHKKPKTRD